MKEFLTDVLLFMKEHKSIFIGGLIFVALMYSLPDMVEQPGREFPGVILGVTLFFFMGCMASFGIRNIFGAIGEVFSEGEKIISSSTKKKTEAANKQIDKKSDIEKNESTGSGFFINEYGYAITNYHVVGDAKNIKMSIKGKDYNAKVVSIDKVNDLALLRTTEGNNDYFRLSANDANRMDDVTAIGYGFAKMMSDEIKTTRGVVSALAGLNNNYSWLQIDATLQPGNSGGPVIDSNGGVIGVAVAKADVATIFEYTGSVPEGISFAIKTSTLKQFLNSNKVRFNVQDSEKKSKDEINKLIDNAALFIFH
tara:strand:+ start:140 stop:1069 length:930 start_codon:yes stop_codon:yes gene_type:complete